MAELAAIKIVINRSRFYSHLYKINAKEEITKILTRHKHLYKKANHHCYAIRVNQPLNKNLIEIFKDDGEVGRPGKILLDILIRNNLDQHALVVSRIFGGEKLGIGGVSRAFKDAGEYTIKHYNTLK